MRPTPESSLNKKQEFLKNHPARKVALQSSPFFAAGIQNIRINNEKECLAIVIKDFSKLPPLSSITSLGPGKFPVAT